jgi:hypothetical protein
MTTHRMHLRCRSAELGSQTADSGIAATFLESSARGLLDANQEMDRNVEYMG